MVFRLCPRFTSSFAFCVDGEDSISFLPFVLFAFLAFCVGLCVGLDLDLVVDFELVFDADFDDDLDFCPCSVLEDSGHCIAGKETELDT